MRKVYVKVVANVLVTLDSNENFDDYMEDFEVLVDCGDNGSVEVLEWDTQIVDSK